MKTVSDELWDTIYFSSGAVPVSKKGTDSRTLTLGNFKVLIKSFKHISVNGDLCRSIPEAKFVIMKELLV
jgi:hypothetical protein